MECRGEHDEHHGHSHGHSHGGGSGEHGHDHDHDHDPAERGEEATLFPYIDMPKVRCMNEHEVDAGKRVFRPWTDRLDRTKFVHSDVDEQLLFFIPFTGNVKLKSIVVIAEPGDEHPRTMRAFKNREDVDFDMAERAAPVQEWQLQEDPSGNLRYEAKLSQFQGIHSLTLFFPDNFGAEQTKIHYIGLRGEFTKVVRDTIITVAEFAANPADHKKLAAADRVEDTVS
eukprot:m.80848 g.80848  ORF g.80848 m.80848 type:complete len:227 (-) comp14860_c6_seq2:777-1457(-)